MKKRIFGLRAKFAVLFLLFAVIIMFSVGAVTYRTYRSSMMKRYASEAVTIAKLAASYLDGDELVGARSTLRAAALTYVAVLASSLASLLRLLLIFGGSRSRRD